MIQYKGLRNASKGVYGNEDQTLMINPKLYERPDSGLFITKLGH